MVRDGFQGESFVKFIGGDGESVGMVGVDWGLSWR